VGGTGMTDDDQILRAYATITSMKAAENKRGWESFLDSSHTDAWSAIWGQV